MSSELRNPLSSHSQVVYSKPMNDKELRRLLGELGQRFDKLENAKTDEPLVDSPFDRKLTRIADDVSGIKSDVRTLDEKVSNHIKFAWACIGFLFALAVGASGTFYSMHGTLTHIEDQLPSGQIKNAIVGPVDTQKLKRIQDIVATAKSSGMAIDPKVVSRAGTRLIEETKVNSPLAELSWQTAIRLAEYRSYENSQVDPSYPNYRGTTPVPAPQEQLPQGIRLFFSNDVFEGVTLDLDGGSWDGVVFKDAIIRYAGGPVILHDVRFENCRFEVPVSIPAQKVAQELLTSSTVTFQNIS